MFLNISSMSLNILVCLYIIIDFAITHVSTMLQTEIKDNLMNFGILSLISLVVNYCGQYVLTMISYEKKIVFLNENMKKYEELDQKSKEKGDPLSFKKLLDQASSVIQMKYNWRINVILNFITTLFSVSYIIILNSQYSMLIVFMIINVSWYFIIIKNMMKDLTQIKETTRKELTILNDLSTLLMIQFHSGYVKIKDLMDIYKKEWECNNKKNIQWEKVSCMQCFPNKLVYVIIPFLIEPELIVPIYIVFKNLNSSISSIMGFMNQYKTFENQLQSLEDFFKDKTYTIKPPQIPLPLQFSFFGSVANVFTIPENNSLDIKQGDHIRIEGPSGIGKTTLIKWIMGFIGEIKYSTNAIPMSYNSYFIWMRQEIREHTPVNTSIRQLINNDEINDSLIIKCLTIVGLLNWFNENIKGNINKKIEGQISGGEKTRLCIALILIKLIYEKGKVLILDEPEQGINPEFASKLLETIFNEFPDVTIIIITHLCDCQTESLKFNKKWLITNDRQVISK